MKTIEHEITRSGSAIGWSSTETLENFCTSIANSSTTSSTYTFTQPISFQDQDQASVMACSFIKDTRTGRRISGSSVIRGRSKRGERRWTSAALLNNRPFEKTHQRKFSNQETKAIGSVSSPPLARNTLSNVNESMSYISNSSTRPLLSSTSRSISTPQVPVSASSTVSSTNKGSIQTRMGLGNPVGKEKERERLLSPCSDLLRGRSISVERDSSDPQSQLSNHLSSGLVISLPLDENQEASLDESETKFQNRKQDEDESTEEEDGNTSSSASSISSLRGGRGQVKENDKEESLRSPRSRRQEILPWLSSSSPISSPEIGNRSPNATQSDPFGSNLKSSRDKEESVERERGRDSIVRLPVRLDELGSNGPELKYPHTVILNKTFLSFDIKSSIQPISSSPKPNSFENDPIFDEVISKLKTLIKTDSDSTSDKTSNLNEPSNQVYKKLLSELWKNSELRKACHGKISWLLDSIRLTDPSEEEIFTSIDSRSEMGELIGSDGKTWSLRLIREEESKDSQGLGLRDLDKELFLVHTSQT